MGNSLEQARHEPRGAAQRREPPSAGGQTTRVARGLFSRKVPAGEVAHGQFSRAPAMNPWEGRDESLPPGGQTMRVAMATKGPTKV